MTKAFSYLRFSTPEQQKGDSRRRQTDLAVEYALRNDLELDTELTFQDLGVSAFRGKNTEVGRLGDFLTAVEDGLVPPGSCLLVESLDRISRQFARKAFRVLEDICDRGITLVTLTDGKAYTADNLNKDPMSLMMAFLTFIRANEESETKSRRLSAAWSAKRAKASERPLTAVCPAWLTLNKSRGEFEVNEDRAAVVQRIFDEASSGKGQNGIAQGLNRDSVPMFGHRGRLGKQWHPSYILKILNNPAVIGTGTPHRMEHSEGVKRRIPLDPVPGYYPPVVSVDLYENLQSMRVGTRQPLRGRHASGEVRNILGGLARCPHCDGSMTLTTKGPNWRYLICARAKNGAGCQYHTVRYADVETSIIESAAEIVIDAPSANSELNRLTERADNATAYVDQLHEQLEGLLTTASHRSSAAIADRIAETEAKLDTARQELADIESKRLAITPLRWRSRLEAFQNACNPLDRQALNVAFRVLLTGVVVDYAAKILRFRWKHGEESFIHYMSPVSVDKDVPRRRLNQHHIATAT